MAPWWDLAANPEKADDAMTSVVLRRWTESGRAPIFENMPAIGVLLLDELPLPQFGESLLQFFLSVHDDRPMPSDGFFNRFAGD